MNTLRRLVLLQMAFWCFACRAADDSLYRHFLSLVDTNDARPREVTSPLLVDKNNAAAKVKGLVLNLASLKQDDGIGGIRLGMTMEEVIAKWGKPRWFWSHCLDRLPTLSFSDAMLGFEGNALKVIRFNTDGDTRFVSELSIHSPIKSWVDALGRPTTRTGSDEGGLLTYSGPKAVMTLQFYEGEMLTIRLERPRSETR